MTPTKMVALSEGDMNLQLPVPPRLALSPSDISDRVAKRNKNKIFEVVGLPRSERKAKAELKGGRHVAQEVVFIDPLKKNHKKN